MADANEINFEDPVQVAAIDLNAFCELVNFKEILNSYEDEFDDIDGILIKRVSCIGGDEGGGERVEWIYSVENPVLGILCHIKFTGYYDSYNGITWDKNESYGDPTYVYPQQVMVTKYTTNRKPTENEIYYGE